MLQRGLATATVAAGGLVGVTSALIAGGPGLFTLAGTGAFIALVCFLTWLRRDFLWVILVAYLLTPGPANNLMPSVNLFPSWEVGYGATELVVLPDLLLLWAVIRAVKTPVSPRIGAGVAALVGIAATGFVVGLDSVPLEAALGQSLLWVRAALVLFLVAAHIHRQGIERVATTLVRAIVLSTTVLAAEMVVLTAVVGDNATIGGFIVSFDGRVRLPGWGNNVAANAVTLGLTLVLLAARRLPISFATRSALVCLHLTALVLGETRLSLLIATAVATLTLVRWAWRRPAGGLVIPGLLAGLLAVPAVASLAVSVNPRFASMGNAVAIFTGKTDTYAAGGGSFATRGELWRAAWHMGLDSPIFGHGWASWGFMRQNYSTVPLEVADPHNGYLYLFAEGGLLAVLVVYVVPALYALRREVPFWLRTALGICLVVAVANPNLVRPQFAAVFMPIVALTACWSRREDLSTLEDDEHLSDSQSGGSLSIPRPLPQASKTGSRRLISPQL